ncbi:hypothetical protein FRX31_020779, partial [Thalictrum thalictroides]
EGIPVQLLHCSISSLRYIIRLARHQVQMDAYSLVTVREPDQILSTSSKLCSESSRGYKLSMDLSNQYRGTSLGTMQQKGSVPVV